MMTSYGYECLMHPCPYWDSCKGEGKCYQQEPIVELTEVVSVNYKRFVISQDKGEDLMPVDEFVKLNSDRLV